MLRICKKIYKEIKMKLINSNNNNNNNRNNRNNRNNNNKSNKILEK